MKHLIILTFSLSLIFFSFINHAGSEESQEWISLFDGTTLNGWKVNESPNSFTVRDGMIVCGGPRAHLFYEGNVQNAQFKNFEFKADVMTTPGANSGIYIHTQFEEKGWPSKGYEIQVNNSHSGEGDYHELKKTGSLYAIRNQYLTIVNDNEWFTMHITVRNKRILIRVNNTLVVDYFEEEKPVRFGEYAERVLSRGTFALQCHDPASTVFFKNIMVRPLPDEQPEELVAPPEVDERYIQLARLQSINFPIVDFHVHLKGGLMIEEALANSRKVGINYGIAPNCGVGFPITDDEGIDEFLESIKGYPVFKGMQAEGREWVDLFSKNAIQKFDYVFTDAMTFTDDSGQRTRLWMRDEVNEIDKQKFMEMYIDRILCVLNNEPINIYVNPTFLPAYIADEYDTLWTEERMRKVINAAVKNKVAIEINARYRLPSAAFIKLGKKAGVKFTFGTNNGDRDLGRLEYCLDMVEECKLTSDDMFMPH